MFNSSSLKIGHCSVKFAQFFVNCGYLNNDICIGSLLILDKTKKEELFLICVISVAIQLLGTIYLIKP